MEAVPRTRTPICEGARLLHRRHPRSEARQVSLKYYVKLAKELEKMGAHFLCIKDMAGLCRPYAAQKLVKALKEEIGIPIHFHTHDTSGINAASILAGGATPAWTSSMPPSPRMSGCTSAAEPQLHRRRAAAHAARHRARPATP